jgi:hypothetical protein
MLRKRFIRVWIGALPAWIDNYRRNTEPLAKYGFEWLIVTDYDLLAERCKRLLDITIAPYEKIAGTRKAGDFDPALGVLFAEELKDYDFWGHTGLDCAYGRLDRFVSDEFLAGCDVFGNDPGAICGPFSLYRNTDVVNRLFQRVGQDGPVKDHLGRTFAGWRDLLECPRITGWDEGAFSNVVAMAAQAGEIRFKSAFWQAHDSMPGHPDLTALPDGSLIDNVSKRETMMFHFNHTRQWPLAS